MKTLKGIIDIHAHADPDKTSRSVDFLELAKMYQDRGVRGMVITTFRLLIIAAR